MGLTALLLRVAAKRPHVLVVSVPGATGVRLALEAALTRRGWPVATGPADADVLAVAGTPGSGLAAVIDTVWEQVPAPRARIEVTAPEVVDEWLDAAAALLVDAGHQRTSPVAPPSTGAEPHDGHAEHGEHGHHGDRAGNSEHVDHMDDGGQAEHEGHGVPEDSAHGDHSDHGDAAAGGHAGHGGGHHGHHAHGGAVGGLPMAELGADRDGLTLDRLHVPLGPVLPDWPAGLVVRVTLQGDVIQEASAEVLDVGQARPFEWPSPVARELDGLARFLGVAGWPSAAGHARRLRDAVLGGAPATEAAGLVRRIRRSRTLRWLIRDIPAGATDVAALLAVRLAAIEAALPTGAGASEPQQGGLTAVQPEQGHLAAARLADLLVGAELAAARLIVAAVDPDTDRVEAGTGGGHG
jgi:Ni,Fe-hydrogenase III small subunit